MLPRFLLCAVCVLAACATEPDAPSPEGTENPVEVPVEAPPSRLTVPGADALGIEPGVPGTDRPENVWPLDDDGRCYGYARYVVRVEDGAGPGQSIAVYSREGDARAQCNGRGRVLFTATGTDTFAGLVGDRLLIDAAAGDGGRALRLLDLAGGEVLHEANYEEPLLVENGALLYGLRPEIAETMDDITTLGVTCDEAVQWFNEDLAVGLSPRVRYNFDTGETTPTGDVLCIPIP